MRARRRLLIVPIVTALSGLLVGPVAGEERTSGAGAYVDEGGNPTAAAEERIEHPAPTSSGPEVSDCTWQVIVEDDTDFAFYDVDGTRLQSDTGRWLGQICDGQPVLLGDHYVVPQTSTQVEPQTLAAEAVRSVPIASPELSTSPPSEEMLFTGVPTWLWLDDGWWEEQQATASAGGVNSTVTARPVRARWSAGDGGGTTCAGPGVAWRPGLVEGATDCSYEYRHSSVVEPDGTFTLSVTVDFEVTWTSNVGEGGRLPGITRSTSRPVRVGEIQAIETD